MSTAKSMQQLIDEAARRQTDKESNKNTQSKAEIDKSLEAYTTTERRQKYDDIIVQLDEKSKSEGGDPASAAESSNMASPPPLEPLDTKDGPVVADFKQTWTTTPFTTFKYFATSKGKTFNIPGGNCFNFAIVFGKSTSTTGGRLMCHKGHGNISIKSKTEDRYYTVDSGVNTPVKMPAVTSRKELSFSVIDGAPNAINKPDGKVENKQTMYDLNYDTTKSKWGTNHYIKGQKGHKEMLETTEAQALEFAKTNALGQNASVFLSRLINNNIPTWGLSVFLCFKKSSVGAKGDLIIKLPKANAPNDSEVITVNVQTPGHEEALKSAKTKLAERIISDKLTVQWTAETSQCFEFLIEELKKK